MKVLIISDRIYNKIFSKTDLVFQEGVNIVFTNWLRYCDYSIFDFDITFVHLTYKTLPMPIISKLVFDTKLALQNGRVIIYLPNLSEESKEERSVTTFSWSKTFGIELRDNAGKNFEAVGRGKTISVQEYLEIVDEYKQIIIAPEHIQSQQVLVTVKNSKIVIGAEFQIENGELVVLPPPSMKVGHELLITKLTNLAQKYNERTLRHTYVENKPEWISEHLLPRLKQINSDLSKLELERNDLELISSVLYTTGDNLEKSVEFLFSRLGLETFPQAKGANIDLKAKHPVLGLGFAIEITGVKGIIQKDTNKIAQANQYYFDSVGTPEENDKLIIVANTEYHLDPKQRKPIAFTEHVIRLIGEKSLLITTYQLYNLWKSVYENKKMAEDIITELHTKSGIYKSNFLESTLK